jgi:hypothetical protein
MQLKPITAIAVLLLVVASLLVSGCTSPTTSNDSGLGKATTNQQEKASLNDLQYISSYVPANFSYNITTPFVEVKSSLGNVAYIGTVQNVNGTMMTMTFEKVSSEKEAQTLVTQNMLNATAKGISPYPASGNAKDTMEVKTYKNVWTGVKFNGFISADVFVDGYKNVSPLGWYVISISGTSTFS